MLTSCCVCHSNGSPALCCRPSCIGLGIPGPLGCGRRPPALGPGCFACKLSKWAPQPLQQPGSLNLRIYYSDFPTKGLIFCSSCGSPLLERIAVRHRSLRRERAGDGLPQAGRGKLRELSGPTPDTPSPAPQGCPSFVKTPRPHLRGGAALLRQTRESRTTEPAGGRLSPSPRSHPPRAQQPVSRQLEASQRTHLHRCE